LWGFEKRGLWKSPDLRETERERELYNDEIHDLYSSQDIVFFMSQQPLLGQGLLITDASRSQSDTPYSVVGLLWTSDQSYIETLPDNTQHSQETDIHAPGGIRIRNPSKRAAADPRLRPRGHCDRQQDIVKVIESNRMR
jgi:hypothetical protein